MTRGGKRTNAGTHKGLNYKQRAFVEHYLMCWNASEAARRAGYKGDANTVGPRLLANVGIVGVIESRLSELQMGADEVLQRLTDQARASIEDYLVFSAGVRLPAIDMDKARQARKLHLLKKYKVGKDGSVEFEMYDAQRALELLGRTMALFADVGLKSDEVLGWREYAQKHGLAENEVLAEAERIARSGFATAERGGTE